MTWNWQQPDWPNFSWQRARLTNAEEQYLVGGGVFVGTANHLAATDNDQLTVEALCAEAVTTSAIEGRFSIAPACNPRSAVSSVLRPIIGASVWRSRGSPR